MRPRKLTRKQQWERLDRSVVRCKRCPRLRDHCREIAKVKRRAYIDQKYWGKPVPTFGVWNADLLVVGLAPGAHGANRTGRMFTGDRSGDWLYRAMFRAGFASQPESVDRNDGLKMKRSAVTSACRCAPPDNKPSREEILHCRPYLHRTIEICQPRVFLALGSIGWRAVVDVARDNGWLETPSPLPKFGHGAVIKLVPNQVVPNQLVPNQKTGRKSAGAIQLKHETTWLVGSYHPSQQNTFTGRLTEQMLDSVLQQVRKLIEELLERYPKTVFGPSVGLERARSFDIQGDHKAA
ncbi:MAG: uracil-DNA glycosylase, partial [Planctomycetota bacterium]